MMLLACPFLTWLNLPVGALTLPVPGLFLRGGFVLAWAILSMGFWLLRPRFPTVLMGTALGVAGTVAFQLADILQRTPRELGRLQLKLSGLNQTLASLNLPEVEIYRLGGDPWDYVGPGIWVALTGSGVLLVGSLLEALLQVRQGRSLSSVLIGRPACQACNQRLSGSMSFCPGCGLKLLPIKKCSQCRAAFSESYRFCPECGATSDSA